MRTDLFGAAQHWGRHPDSRKAICWGNSWRCVKTPTCMEEAELCQCTVTREDYLMEVKVVSTEIT